MKGCSFTIANVISTVILYDNVKPHSKVRIDPRLGIHLGNMMAQEGGEKDSLSSKMVQGEEMEVSPNKKHILDRCMDQ